MPSTRGLAAQGLLDSHNSVRTQKCASQRDCLMLCWNAGEALWLFKLPRDVKNQDLGWGSEDLSKPSWDFSLWAKLLLSSWGEEKSSCAVCCEDSGVFYTAFPRELEHPLWFPLIPTTEIMEMRSSRRLCLRQRSFECPEDEDVRLIPRAEPSKQK